MPMLLCVEQVEQFKAQQQKQMQQLWHSQMSEKQMRDMNMKFKNEVKEEYFSQFGSSHR